MGFNELDDILNQVKNHENEPSIPTEVEKPVMSRSQRAEEEEKRFWEEQNRLEEERQAKLEQEKKSKLDEERQARLDKFFNDRRAEKEASKMVEEPELQVEYEAVLEEPIVEPLVSFVLEEVEDAEPEVNEVVEEIAPPKPAISEEIEEKIEEPQEDVEQAEEKADDEELVWFESKNEESEEDEKSAKEIAAAVIDKIKAFKPKDAIDKIKSIDPKEIKDNVVKTAVKAKDSFVENSIPKIKAWAKKVFTKQVIIALVSIVAVIAAVIGGVKLYEYSKIAYLKPYQEKYKIEYPVGILKQFCDPYGKNQHIVGNVEITDTKTKKYVTYQITKNYAYSHTGTDVNKDQQFRAIDVTGYSDLESVYSTAKGYVDASQLITFNTLFEENQYKVVAAFYTNTNAEDDMGYIFPYNAYGTMTEKSFKAYADRINSRSLYYTGYEMNMEDEFLSVSVDSDFMKDFKFVVLCVKTDKHFEKSTKTSPNKKIHYPQAWYDQNKKENTYRFAAHWYPEIYTNAEKTKTKKLTMDDFDFD